MPSITCAKCGVIFEQEGPGATACSRCRARAAEEADAQGETLEQMERMRGAARVLRPVLIIAGILFWVAALSFIPQWTNLIRWRFADQPSAVPLSMWFHWLVLPTAYALTGAGFLFLARFVGVAERLLRRLAERSLTGGFER